MIGLKPNRNVLLCSSEHWLLVDIRDQVSKSQSRQPELDECTRKTAKKIHGENLAGGG